MSSYTQIVAVRQAAGDAGPEPEPATGPGVGLDLAPGADTLNMQVELSAAGSRGPVVPSHARQLCTAVRSSLWSDDVSDRHRINIPLRQGITTTTRTGESNDAQ